jgi:hypothetical protein
MEENRRRKITLVFGLEETINLARLQVDINVEITRSSGETGDGLNVSSQSIPGAKLA